MTILTGVALMLAPIPTTGIYDGPPPIRFMSARTAIVSFGTVSQCGTPPPGTIFEACVRPPVVYMPNPCDYLNETFGRLMCHELGHLNGWPAKHGP